MNLKKKETAEQKLLKMIEDSGSAAASSTKTQKTVAKKQNALSIIKGINKILVIAVVAFAILLINEIRSGAELLNKDVQFSAGPVAKRTPVAEQAVDSSSQRLSYYLASIRRRNLFEPYQDKQNVMSVTDQNTRIAAKTLNFRLVGISWLDKVETASVMIEDTEKKETHFLQTGEKLEEVVIKTIYADSALLGYENEEMVIRYDKSQM